MLKVDVVLGNVPFTDIEVCIYEYTCNEKFGLTIQWYYKNPDGSILATEGKEYKKLNIPRYRTETTIEIIDGIETEKAISVETEEYSQLAGGMASALDIVKKYQFPNLV